MDAFATLRKQAIEKRNKAISAARSEYRRTIEEIDKLRSRLGCERTRPSRSKAKPILELICDLVPKDRLFSVAEMVAMMREREPDRDFNVPTIRTFFPRLAEQGIIHKVSRNSSGHVLWAAAGLAVEDTPFGATPLTEVAELVLRERGPMRLTELVVEMQGRGFRSDTQPRRLMASLRWATQRYPGRFQIGEDGRWQSLSTVQ